MNHSDDFRSEADGLDDELAVYNDAIDFAELLEASSLGTPEALTARRAGSGVLERYRFTPPHLTDDEPQASDLAQFVSEHFEAHGLSDVADLWSQAAVVEDGALPTSSSSSSPTERSLQSGCVPPPRRRPQRVVLCEERRSETVPPLADNDGGVVLSIASKRNALRSRGVSRVAAALAVLALCAGGAATVSLGGSESAEAVALAGNEQAGAPLWIPVAAGVVAPVLMDPDTSTESDTSTTGDPSAPVQSFDQWAAFGKNGSTLSLAGKSALNETGSYLNSNEEYRAVVWIYTHRAPGSVDDPLLLVKREQAVADTLDSLGVPESRLTIESISENPAEESSGTPMPAGDEGEAARLYHGRPALESADGRLIIEFVDDPPA